MRSNFFTSTLAIALGVANPIVISIVFPEVAVAQAVDQRKVEADRLLRQGIQLGREGIRSKQSSYYQVAIKTLEQALNLYRQLQDRFGEAQSLSYLGAAHLSLGDKTKAISLSQQAVDIAKELRNSELEKLAIQGLDIAQKQATNPSQVSPKKASSRLFYLFRQGIQQRDRGQPISAIKSWEEALQISRSMKSQHMEEWSLRELGNTHLKISEYGKSIEYLEQSLAISHKRQNAVGEGQSLAGLGVAYFYLGNWTVRSSALRCEV